MKFEKWQSQVSILWGQNWNAKQKVSQISEVTCTDWNSKTNNVAITTVVKTIVIRWQRSRLSVLQLVFHIWLSNCGIIHSKTMQYVPHMSIINLKNSFQNNSIFTKNVYKSISTDLLMISLLFSRWCWH